MTPAERGVKLKVERREQFLGKRTHLISFIKGYFSKGLIYLCMERVFSEFLLDNFSSLRNNT